MGNFTDINNTLQTYITNAIEDIANHEHILRADIMCTLEHIVRELKTLQAEHEVAVLSEYQAGHDDGMQDFKY